MYKKLSMLLCITIFIQLFSFAAVSANDEAVFDAIKERHILNRIGVTAIEENPADAPVSRATFAVYLAKALKLSEVTDKIYFPDVSKDYWAAGYINSLVDAGIVNGGYDGLFNPDDTVTYEQASKMIVVATGYKAHAEAIGGMSGYMRVASRIGVKLDLVSNEELVLSEALKLLYMSMITPIVNPTGIKDGNVVSKVEDDTLFSTYHNVYIVNDRVESICGASLNNDEDLAQNEIIAGGYKYILDEGYDMKSCFGYEAEIVYIEGSDDIKTIIYAEKLSNNNSKIISSELVTDFDLSNYALIYRNSEESNKTSSLSISRGANIIFNGRKLSGSIVDKIKDFAVGKTSGSIEYIKNVNSDEADILIINSYRTYIIGSYDSNDNVLYNQYDNTDIIDLTDVKALRITDSQGKTMDMPASLPAVTQVAMSDDGYTAEFIVYSVSEDATITEIVKNEHKIIINGSRYDVDEAIYPYIEDKLVLNTNIKYMLDKNGKVIYIDFKQTGRQIAYLRCVRMNDNIFDKDITFDLYMTDGLFHSYQLAENVKVDGDKYKKTDYQTFISRFPGDVKVSDSAVVITPQPILVEVNSEDEIVMVDTYNVGANEDKKNTLTQRLDGSVNSHYNKTLNRFGIGVILGTGTKYMYVPSEDGMGKVEINGIKHDVTEKMYATTCPFEQDHSYAIEAYYFDDSTAIADIIVFKRVPTIENETILMFDELRTGINAEGFATDVLVCRQGSTEYSYIVDESCVNDARALNRGDLVRLEIDYETNNVVHKIVKMFDCKTMKFVHSTTNDFWYAGTYSETSSAWRAQNYQITKSYPYDIKNGILRTSYKLSDAVNGVTNEAFNITALGFTIYDKNDERNPIYDAKFSDLVTYSTAGANCPVILTTSSTFSIHQVYVYK